MQHYHPTNWTKQIKHCILLEFKASCDSCQDNTIKWALVLNVPYDPSSGNKDLLECYESNDMDTSKRVE